jgi:3-oxoadipate enol-lactonase
VEGPDDAPVLMLSNSLGTNLHMWDPQAKAFSEKFRLVRYDRRGHGKSGAPKGPYSMERFGRDVLAIIDGLGIKKINWCGLSMGGMVGQWLGANAPDRIEKLILSNTTCYYADRTPWVDRIKFVREKGLAAIVPGNMERWFTKEFRERSPETMKWMSDMFLTTPVEGYIGCCEAIASMDHRASRRRHWSSPASTIRRPMWRPANISRRTSPARRSPFLRRLTFRMSSCRISMPKPFWTF